MLDQINLETFNIINNYAGKSEVIDGLIVIIAEYLPIIFIVFLLYLWFSTKDKKRYALYSGYSTILGILLNFLITLLYFHPRPFMDGVGTLLITHTPETSFPSDHTTFMFSIAFTLLYFKQTRTLGILLSLLGCIGGISRVYCGVHYPFNIFGSLLVSLISSSIIFLFTHKLQKLNLFIIHLYYKTFKIIGV